MKSKILVLTATCLQLSCSTTLHEPNELLKAPEKQPILTSYPVDDFYKLPVDNQSKVGNILNVAPLVNVSLPKGVKGWKIQYSTSIDDSTPATAVATIFQSVTNDHKPSPVIIWEHGTTGLQQKCMPSLASIPTMGIPALEKALKSGWTIIATDYSFTENNGPHSYLIGEGEGRAGLDSLRAAAKIAELNLDLNNTVVWGHSQGGHASLWTGIIAPTYAPEIKLKGVVAIAPAANLIDIMTKNQSTEKRLGPYIASAYSRFYPDITFETAIRSEALEAAKQITNLCGFLPASDPAKISELTKTFNGSSLNFDNNANLLKRLKENNANKKIQAPVLVTQGLDDVVVRPEFTDAYVSEQCKAGQVIEYLRLKGKDHGTIVRPNSTLEQPIIQWTSDRFDNKEFNQKCVTIEK